MPLPPSRTHARSYNCHTHALNARAPRCALRAHSLVSLSRRISATPLAFFWFNFMDRRRQEVYGKFCGWAVDAASIRRADGPVRACPQQAHAPAYGLASTRFCVPSIFAELSAWARRVASGTLRWRVGCLLHARAGVTSSCLNGILGRRCSRHFPASSPVPTTCTAHHHTAVRENRTSLHSDRRPHDQPYAAPASAAFKLSSASSACLARLTPGARCGACVPQHPQHSAVAPSLHTFARALTRKQHGASGYTPAVHRR